MRQRLEARKLLVARTSIGFKAAEQDVKNKEENLGIEVRSLLVGGTSLSVAKSKLQEANSQLEGEGGYARLKVVTSKLRKRQQYMITQVSSIYPLKIEAGPSLDQELESFPGGSRFGSKPMSQGTVTILGLPFSMAPFTKMSLFTEKKEAQRSATALGYVAHAVSLTASYMTVPLRYPLRLGGSKSYIRDYAPYIEPSSSSDMSPMATLSQNQRFVEFPLFLDGQDTTRAAYAVFLLNKDIEQMLNYVGASGVGPRQVLSNLKELIRTVQSPEFIDT
ncbi:PREDICTED: uncharacterized protein LOC104826120 isoform X2 [Tarenaya hassleriana]|nr:PREDICTED: uncharacterized protein LOC104826120 isoform X2 [Tarenaya hassleriana]XP_010556959.1 PREDICTED: uncharacterized protein LOC104826120 isoform X2 [Tarenaya hassleriana]XP_010556960.1 PREDICTED: uncharacterized protein LOC104826120 isoform X2 [Tarenaya hassleriana]